MEEDGEQTATGEMKKLTFDSAAKRDAALAILASNTFALHYVTWSSCQVVNSPDLLFPVNLPTLVAGFGKKLQSLARRLIADVHEKSIIQTRNYSARGRTYTMRKQYFFFKKSKPILDEIDRVLAEHYGFTDEELDFILNYDIKYRLSLVGDTDDDE